MSRSRRIQGVTYGAPGSYLITVIARRRLRRFGQLTSTGVRLTSLGTLVGEMWQHVPVIRPWVRLGAWIVMPDHFHGILDIGHAPAERSSSLSALINGFKGAVTVAARTRHIIACNDLVWQASYDVRFLWTVSRRQAAEDYVLTNPFRAWQRSRSPEGDR